MSAVLIYQDALRVFTKTQAEWHRLRRRISATASFMERGNPMAFMTEVKGEPSDNMSFRHSEWPSADDIATIAKAYTDSEVIVKAAWKALSGDELIGLNPPNLRTQY